MNNKLLLGVLLFLSALPIALSFTDAPYLYYNGTGYDIEVYGTDIAMTVTGAPTFTTGVNSTFGNAVNGLSSSAFLNYTFVKPQNGNFSFCHWILSDGAMDYPMFIMPTSNSDVYYWGYYSNSRVRLKGASELDTAYAMTSGSWSHFCSVENSTHLTLYVNGTYITNVANSNVNADDFANPLQLVIGKWFGSNDVSSTDIRIDEVYLFNYTITSLDAQKLYTEGYYASGDSSSTGAINVNITSPEDNYGFNATRLVEVGYKIWINATFNQSNATCSINGTEFIFNSYNITTELDGLSKVRFLNNTALSNDVYNYMVNCSDPADALINGSDTISFTVDTTPPSIAPLVLLSNNKTFVVNGTLTTQINFSDDLEIYSINVTFANGTNLYYGSNLGQDNYQLNVSYGVDTTISNYLDIRVCDAHTAEEITPIDRIDTVNKGLKYVIEDNPLWMPDKWVSIYPKLGSEYTTTPMTSLFKDRYTFTFEKTAKTQATETFIVESTEFIDISKVQKYKGHLIIPSISRWIDFENSESTKTEIKRISDNKVEVIVYGLKSNTITFNSIGELNCVEDRLYFGNLNPVIRYTNYVLSSDTTTFYINISEPDMISTLSTKLWYNNTYYVLGTEPNYTQSITLPSGIVGNNTNKSFNVVITANGVEYNSSYLQQNISNWFLDNCSSYETKSLNFTIRNELNNSLTDGDMDGEIFYSVGSTTKTYSFTPTLVVNEQVCIFPSFADIDSDYYVYYSASDYPQRRYYANDTTINSTFTTIPLYLLQSAYGIYIRFMVSDSLDNVLSEVQVTAKTLVSGTQVTVEQENTDDSGLATFFLNPDSDYTFTFEKSGYTTTSFSLRPTSSEIYYVTMGGGLSTGTTEQPSGTGISYSFSPNNQELLNATNYTFSFSLTSEYWDITDCTLYLKNATQTLTYSSTSWDSDSCDISINYNTGNQTSIYSLAVYEVNSTLQNATQTYSVSYYYTGTFSLKNFIDDISAFGEAGFDDFTRMVIAFIVILALVGLAAMKMSINEPEPLIIMFLALTFIFSLLGWLYLDIPTIAADSNFVILEKYGIFTLLSLIGGSYLIKRATE